MKLSTLTSQFATKCISDSFHGTIMMSYGKIKVLDEICFIMPYKLKGLVGIPTLLRITFVTLKCVTHIGVWEG